MLNNDSSFAYIQVGHDYYHIKDMFIPEVKKVVLAAKVGDTLRIDKLGVFQLIQVFFFPHRDMDSVINEIGLICRRIDA